MAKGHTRYCGLFQRAARGNIISGTQNCRIYCYIFLVYTQSTKVAAGRTTQPGELRVGEVWLL
jgi:hypothetical protein